jgi:hypothetical protein
MRAFALSALLGLVALNCFLAYSGQTLAREIRRVVVHDGVKLSVVSEAAFILQPWFYLVALAAFVATGLGFGRRLSEHVLIYAVVGFLVLDIVGLLLSIWGFSHVHFLL